MNKNQMRERLIGLGPERLADLLLSLASRSGEVDQLVKRTVSPPERNVKTFKSKLEALKKSKRFIDWRGAWDYAQELESMLDDLAKGCDDPEVGLEQIKAFFEADEQIFEQCDDSSGNVGSVFQCAASDLFARYASDYPDKSRVIDLVIELNESDEYGVRDVLFDAAHKFLSKDMLRMLADRLRQKIAAEPSRRWFRALASIARQLKDAPLYEEALRGSRQELHPRMYSDVAELYLETGDAETALSKFHRAEAFGSDNLLLNIYLKLGRTQEAEETAWRIFRGYRAQENLVQLLSLIGEDRRPQVVSDEVSEILGAQTYSSSDAAFLLDIGLMNEAEEYILAHRDELDGERYTSLLPIAEAMEKDGRQLVATIIYRALLESILARGVSKHYHHGVRYLTKLDRLAGNIEDWKNLTDHETYKASMRTSHGRKTAFWSRYEEDNP